MLPRPRSGRSTTRATATALLVLALAATAAAPVAADPPGSPAPDRAPAPARGEVGVRLAQDPVAGAPARAQVVVLDEGTPVAGVPVDLVATAPDGSATSTTRAFTDVAGQADTAVTLPAAGRWSLRATVHRGDGDLAAEVSVQAARAPAALELLAAPASAVTGERVTVTARLTGGTVPVPGAPVEIREGAAVLARSTTDDAGTATASLLLPTGDHELVALTPATAARHGAVSAPVAVTVEPSALAVRAAPTRPVVSGAPAALVVEVAGRSNGRPRAGARVAVATRLVGARAWIPRGAVRTGPDGAARFVLRPWKTTQVQLTASSSGTVTQVVRTVPVRPARRPVTTPPGWPQPRVRHPDAPPPRGSGAATSITAVPTAVRRSMLGRSWQRGCLPFASLRYVSVNYWGFDGYRYRGHLVVAASAARATARVFARLHALQYPVRSILLPDRFGRHPFGPGADDYASMAADNTYGFNCRYVVGKEDLRVWSPHAGGRAIDINTFENPYVARTGVFPDRWWLPRTRRHVAVLTARSPATRAFVAHGFAWGGSYADYQHFER